ncbi:MAG: GSCFA domain-containing protein [Pseudomonadota bacterium]
MADRNILKMPADAAYRVAVGNRHRNYPAPGKDGDRLYPIATPYKRPGFTIAPDETVFALGSCFARNIERVLTEKGMSVLSTGFDFGGIEANTTEPGNFFNKYSIHSIASELGWAFDRESFPGEAILYQGREGEGVFDLQLGSALLKSPLDEVLAFRHRYLDAIALAAEADVVIVTLGYVETWYDTELDLYLNVAPIPNLIKRMPGRFEFRVLGYQDVLDGLRETYRLLSAHRTRPMKMLVTVSPVPLKTTFRDMDVLVANAYSKSVQRAAIDEFLLETRDVDYFPSYEFVTLSHPDTTWRPSDYRHLSLDFVNHIMTHVLGTYLPGTATGDAPDTAIETRDLLAAARLKVRAGEHGAALALIDARADLVADSDGLLLTRETCLNELGREAETGAVLARLVEIAPGRPRPLERLISIASDAGDTGEVARLLHLHRERFPNRDAFREQAVG